MYVNYLQDRQKLGFIAYAQRENKLYFIEHIRAYKKN
jgi:hypothetical protein